MTKPTPSLRGALATKQSSLPFWLLDCFACARNDGVGVSSSLHLATANKSLLGGDPVAGAAVGALEGAGAAAAGHVALAGHQDAAVVAGAAHRSAGADGGAAVGAGDPPA